MKLRRTKTTNRQHIWLVQRSICQQLFSSTVDVERALQQARLGRRDIFSLSLSLSIYIHTSLSLSLYIYIYIYIHIYVYTHIHIIYIYIYMYLFIAWWWSLLSVLEQARLGIREAEHPWSRCQMYCNLSYVCVYVYVYIYTYVYIYIHTYTYIYIYIYICIHTYT